MKRKERRKPEENSFKLDKIVVDTSAVIHGKLLELASNGSMDNGEIIIPEIVMGELQ